MTPALRTRGLTRMFGSLPAADGIDFELAPGARHALIGPNGAGKTTFVNLVTGRVRPTAGRIELAGRDVTDLDQPARVKLGIGRTFQINQLFPELTALESVAMAVDERRGRGWAAWRPFGSAKETIEEAADIVDRFGLADDSGLPVRELSYGRQRIVEIALALALKPTLLLLDEPVAGVPEAETGALMAAIRRLPSDVSVLIIEHDMDVVFRFADAITVLHQGRILAEGTPAAIASDARVKEIYFGEREIGHG